MADYIYLLQTRLTPAQWRALEAVREAARAHALTVFLVGGAVRDLTSGSPVRDLEFAVQGDPATLLPDLEARGATVVGRHPVFSSVYLNLRGGVRAEVGPTLKVSYPKPGQPSAEPAAILDDLRRRDFTANAMAISLNEGSYGLLLDPLNGTADIENRDLRLVSNYGFIEQPAFLLRGARLTGRLGWGLEERTQARYATAKQENYIETLLPFDRGYELEEIFHEEDPLSIFEHMESEGWREALFAPLDVTKVERAGLDAVRDLAGQLESLGIHPDASVVNFPLLTAALKDNDVIALKKLFARPGFVQQIESMDARSKDLVAQLSSKSASLPSETWKLLFATEPEVVLWTAFHSRSSAVQAKLKSFLREWPQMRQKLPYALMQEMRITPELPGYDQLLDDLFFALIDGKLSTAEATRAFLEPFSPPAPPPQVNVRRRPAKATRGRGRKVAEEPVAADPDDVDDEDVVPDLVGSREVDSRKDEDEGPEFDDDEPEPPVIELEPESDPEEEMHDEPVVEEPVPPPQASVVTLAKKTASKTPAVVVSVAKVPETAGKKNPSKPNAAPTGGKAKAASKSASPAPAPKKAVPVKASSAPKQASKASPSGGKSAAAKLPAKAVAKSSVKKAVAGKAAKPAGKTAVKATSVSVKKGAASKAGSKATAKAPARSPKRR